jgi:hypothetical protein
MTLIGRWKKSFRTVIVFDCIVLFLFTAALIRPLFKAKYLDKWPSIESTFIADARFLVQHWPHPQWQPLWYGGTRFDYIYPPALRYGTAFVSKTLGYIPAKAYHVYTAFFYCAGIAGVYLLIRVGSRSRGEAWLGALAAATMSPSFLAMRNFRLDAWKLTPMRLGVLVKYGEGPHMTSLALIPLALAFTWLALERPRAAMLALAAVFSAAVTSHNFYGATSLAVFFPILLWSHWITRQDRRILAPAIGIPGLAYGLTAFWLVPSYFRITAENMQYVAERGSRWSIALVLAVTIAFVMVTRRLARKRPERTWAVFLAGSMVFFTLNVLGNYFFHFRVTGEPLRWVPELDTVWIMVAASMLHWMWKRPLRGPKVAAVAVVVAAFASTAGYVRHAWEIYPLWPNYQDRIEYRVSDWMARNLPDARAFTSGSVRFWYDAWFDNAQLGGGSEQGLMNGLVQSAQWEVNQGRDPALSILWMQCFGVDAYYVSDSRSEEIYHDTLDPRKFAGILAAVYDDGRGNWIYRVPRRWTARARVVETVKLNGQGKPRANDDIERIRRYGEMLEKGPDSPVTVTRLSTDAVRIHARMEPGQSLSVQETYDTPWQAWAEGKRLAVRKDAFGQMAIDAAPGEHDILLAFVTPLENVAGRIATGLSLLAVVVLLGLRQRA